jgi:hypothetical protein
MKFFMEDMEIMISSHSITEKIGPAVPLFDGATT